MDCSKTSAFSEGLCNSMLLLCVFFIYQHLWGFCIQRKVAVPPVVCSFTSVQSSSGEWSCIAVTQHSFFWQYSSSQNLKFLNKTWILFFFIPFHWSFQGHLHKTPKILDGRAREKALLWTLISLLYACGKTLQKRNALRHIEAQLIHFCLLCDQYWKHYHLFKNKKVFSLISYSAMQMSVMLNIPHLNSSVNLVCR